MEFLYLCAIPLLIAINALFVAAEYSLVAVRKTRVDEMVAAGLKGAKSLAEARANMNRSIAASQLGITVASIALGAVGEPTFAHFLEPLFGFVSENVTWLTKHGIATALALFCITIIHVILGEQMPKLAALQSVEKTALRLVPPLQAFARSTAPVLAVMNGVGNFLLRRLGYKLEGRTGPIHSVGELMMLIDETENAGLIDAESADYVQNVFELRDKTVADCMVPLEKMDALELHSTPDRTMAFVRACGHTRIPVFDGAVDNVIGILNTKNLFHFFSLMNVVVLDDALYPASYLGADEPIAAALRLFKKTKVPMAMVRGAGGKVVGMITLEDIVEEIVGDIEDEHDGPITKLVRVPRRTGEPGRPPFNPKVPGRPD